MSLLGLLVFLIAIGVVLYLINLIPMDATIKRIILIVVIVFIVIWLLQSTGLLGSLGRVRIK